MLVERLVISASEFFADDNVNVDRGVALAANLRVDRTHRPEDIATLAALGDGVVGCLIGYIKDGTPAVAALYRDANGSLRHGRPRALNAVCASAERPLLSV